MVYLDNASSTPVIEEAAQAAFLCMTEKYYNPSSITKEGLELKTEIEAVRRQLAEIVNCSSQEVIFTSGGTESNNLAINGTLERLSKKGGTIITTLTEHPSVLNAFKYWENKGLFKVVYLKPERDGAVSEQAIRSALTEDTVFISMMLANNETGVLNPVSAIRRLLKERGIDASIHSDCVAALGKVDLDFASLNVDLISISGHKINAPKGIGALLKRKNYKLTEQLRGGGQESGIRSGTENSAAIIALGKALEFTFKDFENRKLHYSRLYSYMLNKLQNYPFILNTSAKSNNAVVSLSVPYVPSEVTVRMLNDAGIAVSAGSACSSGKKGYSGVLRSMSLPEKQLKSTVRVSFGFQNTEDEIDFLLLSMQRIYNNFKEMSL